MSLEEGTSFWSSSLMWKVFFCAAIAFPTFNAGKNIMSPNRTSEIYRNKINTYLGPYLRVSNAPIDNFRGGIIAKC